MLMGGFWLILASNQNKYFNLNQMYLEVHDSFKKN